MKLTPLDIHHKEFGHALRGYNEVEVDQFLDQVADELERLFKENAKEWPNITAVKQDCLDFLRGLKEPLAFLHVDADHDYELVRDTINLALPLLVPGGILCGHDYVDAPGVQQAVKELLPKHDVAGQVWWWSK